MATAGDSGVSGAAAGTTALSLEQLREYLLAWGVPESRLEKRSRQLQRLDVTLLSLAAAAAQPLNVLQALLTDQGEESTPLHLLDASTIKEGVLKAAGPSGLISKRALLRLRLPEPEPDPQVVPRHREGAPKALHACPKQLRHWVTYDKIPVDHAIQQFASGADDEQRWFSPFQPRIALLRSEQERDVAAALKLEPVARLNALLQSEDQSLLWRQELTVGQADRLWHAMREAPLDGGQQGAAPQTAGAALGGMVAQGTGGQQASLGGLETHPGTAVSATAAGPSAAWGQRVAGTVAVGAGAWGAVEVQAQASGTATATASAAAGSAAVYCHTGREVRAPKRWAEEHSSVQSGRTSSRGRADYALLAQVEEAKEKQHEEAKEEEQEQQQQHQSQPQPQREHLGARASTSSRRDTGMPTWEQLNHKFVAVAEVKRYGKLFDTNGQPLPLPLVQLWSEEGEEADSIRRIIQQLFTYMVATGVQYGWLSCYCAAWLAWSPLDEPDILLLSRPFLHDVAASSAPAAVTQIAALAWLQQLAVVAWREGVRHQRSTHLLVQGDGDALAEPESEAKQVDPCRRSPPISQPSKAPRFSERGTSDTSAAPSSNKLCTVAPPVQWLPMGAVRLGVKIGEGASAVVFRGWCMGKEAAIKMVDCSGAMAAVRHEARAYQVLGEAQAAGAVPTLFGVGR